MGGPSSERDVSLRSGAAVARGLREAGYDVSEVDVTGRTLELPAGTEAVFVALHGEFGEDGQVQALLEEKGIPYTGSNPEASRASFDKLLTKDILVKCGVSTPRYEVLRKGQPRTLPLPVVVKPPRQGSSIGVHRVFNESEWTSAIEDAFRFDMELLVEEYIEGRELTVGVVGHEVMPIVEIVAPGDWYSYDAKYTKGKTQYRVPADIGPVATAKCVGLALQTFKALGCAGFGRVDIRLAPDGGAYVLELNNIPGFTETSLLPKAASEYGLSFPTLCDRIMNAIPTR
jgi:D-alanine-D-alanine ligase